MNKEITEILKKFTELCEREAMWDKVGQTYYNAKKLLREQVKNIDHKPALGCVIFRIDGNRCFSAPIKGIMGHFKTKEGAEKYLKQRGFYLETRKWQHIEGHEEGTEDSIWYNNKLSEDGYSYDNTSYAIITEVELRD